MSGRRSLASGFAGEDEACAFLERQGFRILKKNYRTRGGEVDVVARDGRTLVFVEVKRSQRGTHGTAIERVTPAKRRRVVAAARSFAASRGLSEEPIRFDVVAIDPAGTRHERGAFDAGEW